MKKGWKITVIIGLFWVIGGGISYAMGFDKDYFDYLDRKNYTEKYISPIEGDDSYVLYKAQNEQFSIKLPKDFIILEETHGTSSDTQEIFNAVYRDPETKGRAKSVGRRLQVLYNQLSDEHIEVATQRALESYLFEDQYQEIKMEKRIVYIGESHVDAKGKDLKILDAKEHGTNTFFGFVLEKETNDSIEISYTLRCLEGSEEKCEYNEKQEREIFKQLLESISFARR